MAGGGQGGYGGYGGAGRGVGLTGGGMMFGGMQPAPGGGFVGGRGGATPGGYLNSFSPLAPTPVMPTPVMQPGPVGTGEYKGGFGNSKDGSGLNMPPSIGLPPGLSGTMGGTGSGPGGLGTAYLGMPGGMPGGMGGRGPIPPSPLETGRNTGPFIPTGNFPTASFPNPRTPQTGVYGFSAGMRSPFAVANPITGPTGAGGYSDTARSMNSGGVAYANGGSTRFRRFTPTRTLPSVNTTNIVGSTVKGGAVPQSFSDWYSSFYQPKNPQEAYNLTLAMAQSPEYAAYYNSLSPAAQANIQPPLSSGSGAGRNISDSTNQSTWNYLASQAQHSYEQFGGKDPFTGRMYGEPPTVHTGPQQIGTLDESGNLIPYGTVTSGGFVLPNRRQPGGTGTGGTGTGGTGTGGTGTGGTGIGGTGTGGTGTGGTGGTGTGGTGGTGTGGTGTGGGGWGGGGGGGSGFIPPPTYNAPEFPNLAFGYPWVPERLKALRAQQGIVPGGGGVPTTPPAVSTKAAKSGGIMSLMRRKG